LPENNQEKAMSGALKWSPFDSSRWPSATEATGRTPPQFMDSIGRAYESGEEPAAVRVEENIEATTLVVEAQRGEQEADRDTEHFPSGLRYSPFISRIPLLGD
jgi:HSP20 family protein